jgi:alkylation response protein AidB-like acyl-CoA dehydrogenase
MSSALPLGVPEPRHVPPAIATLDSLLVEIAARRERFMADRQIPVDIVEQFKTLGVYRALVARRFGGDERTPAEFCRLIERIAQADGSAGWVASFGAAATYLAALPEHTLRQVYANGPDVVFAGGLFPLQPALWTEGGYRVSGRWKFASGCTGASLIGVGIVAADDSTGGLPRVAVMKRAQVRIVPDWNVIGLQGTGSHDLVVEDAIVPQDWTLIRGGPASIDVPIYRYPTIALAAQVLAVVGLGVARAALDEIVAAAGGRISITGAGALAERPHVQMQVGRAEALLGAARAFFYEATEAVWTEVLEHGRASPERTSTLRLATTHAAQTGAEVARLMFALAGTTAIDDGHVLSRALRDSLVVAQHALLNDGTIQNAGRVRLGLTVPPGFP